LSELPSLGFGRSRSCASERLWPSPLLSAAADIWRPGSGGDDEEHMLSLLYFSCCPMFSVYNQGCSLINSISQASPLISTFLNCEMLKRHDTFMILHPAAAIGLGK